MTRIRAAEQHVDYFRQLKAPRPSREVEVDPKVQGRDNEMRQVFKHPELTWQLPPKAIHQQPFEQQLLSSPVNARKFEGTLNPHFDLSPFGSLEVQHGNIFSADVDAIILPMTENLTPYRGLSLEAYDRGGEDLVKETWDAFRELVVTETRDTEGVTKKRARLLSPGDAVALKQKHFDKTVIFVITPWFWQGSQFDAAKRFRHCVKQGLLKASSSLQASSLVSPITSVALPHIGCGVYGYEPSSSSRILLEEAVEVLLEIETTIPRYSLKEIKFVDARLETAKMLQSSLVEVAHRWIPEKRLTSAAQYWGSATRRLVVLPAVSSFFWKRNRVKFKRNRAVPKMHAKHYKTNIKPTLWRAHRVHQPPPLLVLKTSGEAAESKLQHAARPYYFRGVSHWLFPSSRSGFHGLRRSGHGHWVGVNKHYRPSADVRPRL